MMHWAQKIAIAKEARETGAWMRTPHEDDMARLGERLDEEASRKWDGTLDLRAFSFDPIKCPICGAMGWHVCIGPQPTVPFEPFYTGNVWTSDRTE